MANKNRAGSIVHRYKEAQELVDKALDKKAEKEPSGVPKPQIMPNGARCWTFG